MSASNSSTSLLQQERDAPCSHHTGEDFAALRRNYCRTVGSPAPMLREREVSFHSLFQDLNIWARASSPLGTRCSPWTWRIRKNAICDDVAQQSSWPCSMCSSSWNTLLWWCHWMVRPFDTSMGWFLCCQLWVLGHSWKERTLWHMLYWSNALCLVSILCWWTSWSQSWMAR